MAPSSPRHTRPRLDLVLVAPNLRLGGVQRAAVNITGALASEGYSVTLATTVGPHSPHFRPHADVRWVDVIAELESQGTPSAGGWLSTATDRFLARTGRALIDAGLGPPGGRAARRLWTGRTGPNLLRAIAGQRGDALRTLLQADAPRSVLSLLTRTNVITAAALWDLPTHFVPSFRADVASIPVNEPWSSLEWLAFERAERVTANSKTSVEALARSGVRDVTFLPNIVTTEPTPSPEHPSRFVISARLTPVKGVDLAIEAFSLVAHRLPGWTLEVFGDGPMRADLERLAQDRGLAGRVIFAGAVDPIERLPDGGVFLMPSRHAEGSPNALLEALGAGLPAVIWDDVPGTHELVRTGESGIRVAPDDVPAFAEAMLEIASSRRLFASLREGAHHAVDGHRWSQCRGTYLEVLDLC